MARVIHPVAGMIAGLTILSFWLSTALTEALGTRAAVIALKTHLPWALLLLIPMLATVAGTGTFLARGQRRGPLGAKARRMPWIAANGLLVLVPSALLLAYKAGAGQLDSTFYAVQALELAAGGTNLVLLGLSVRDGLSTTAWRRGSFLRAAPVRTARVLATEEIARGTIALRIEKPTGFTFRAGQAIYLSLTAPPPSDDKGRIRTFSIASAPHEGELLIATRISDSTFKNALGHLPPGAPLAIEGPYGDLALHADPTRPAVFLCGGIGITPFRSMILDAVERGLTHRLILFAIDRTADRAVFRDELRALHERHPRFELVVTTTGAGDEGEAGDGMPGGINRPWIEQHVPDLLAPIYYVAGPPAMVAAMAKLLREAGVNRQDVRLEAFDGYARVEEPRR